MLIRTVCLCLALWLPSAESQALEPFSHQYKSTFAGFGAKASRTLAQVEPGVWELTMTARNLIARYRETSRFTLDEQGYPVPRLHHFEGRLFGIKREEVTRFDWSAGTATWEHDGETRTAELHPGVLDRILYQVLVPGQARSGEELLSFEFVNRGELRTYEFARVGEEAAEIDGQPLQTIKMRRVDDDEEKQTDIWVAPALDYKVVKIHHRDEDGADYTMELKLEQAP